MNVKSVTKDWLTDNIQMSKSITLHKKWDFVDVFFLILLNYEV